MSIGSAPSGSTSTLKPLRNPAASNAWFHQLAPSTSAFFTSSGAPESTQVLNRLHRLAHRRVRILLLETMAADVADLHRLADRHAVVDEGEAAVAGARVVGARLVVVVGQLDQRHVLAQRHRVGGRRHARDRAGEEAAAAAAAATRPAAAFADRRRALRGPAAPPPPRPPAASLTKVSVISISVFFGNALVRGR